MRLPQPSAGPTPIGPQRQRRLGEHLDHSLREAIFRSVFRYDQVAKVRSFHRLEICAVSISWRGCVLREMWLKSKSSLNRERKKPVRTLVHQATSLLHSVYCGGWWDR
ncbi:unnamed protein product [Rangifer tarandus platyrhynchus]|uniref:F-box domain-containing protein n=1 Tax=Rangifer tarandus platyrhynchus TaxID=3082113 RepID=A0ABN8YRV5_RANTA|nr:unnamed protein product [Rangifer tarandus platyrhynchus]